MSGAKPRLISWPKLLLAVVCCALAFGGTFTCKSDNNSSEFTENPTTGAG